MKRLAFSMILSLSLLCLTPNVWADTTNLDDGLASKIARGFEDLLHSVGIKSGTTVNHRLAAQRFKPQARTVVSPPAGDETTLFSINSNGTPVDESGNSIF